MFDSLGLGELGLILVVALVFIDPSKIGTLARGLATLRRKWNTIQRDVKQQFDALTLEENLKESADAVRTAKAALRREALDAVRAIPSGERAVAAAAALDVLVAWDVYRNAETIALFCGTREELDTESMIRRALADGKTVLLPRVVDALSGSRRHEALGPHHADMVLVPIRNYDRDLDEGAFGILEPRADLIPDALLRPSLILIPGTAFDEAGGRVGRGKGFYDRYLETYAAPSTEHPTPYKAGLAFEVQIVRKKLPLEPHDQRLDALVTERRLRTFASPQTSPQNA
jgi:5-formyltetrahydrofolate cyclo-ligase